MDRVRRLLMRISISIPPDPGMTPKNGLEPQHSSSHRRFDRRGSLQLPIRSLKLCRRTLNKNPTLQYSKQSEHVTSRGIEDEDSVLSRLRSLVLSRLRSLRIFNQDMKDELVKLFHPPDPLTGNKRNSEDWDYWVHSTSWLLGQDDSQEST